MQSISAKLTCQFETADSPIILECLVNHILDFQNNFRNPVKIDSQFDFEIINSHDLLNLNSHPPDSNFQYVNSCFDDQGKGGGQPAAKISHHQN